MRLGTETGSVNNWLDSRAVVGEPKPYVGMGATILCWTDRRPATIVKVEEIGGSKVSAYIIEVVEDDYRVVSGSTMDGSAVYEFSPADGYRRMYRKNRKTGYWEEVVRNPETGKLNKTKGNGLMIGRREKWVDPSF